MPVIKCPGCGSMISTKATACSKCGWVMKSFVPNNSEIQRFSQHHHLGQNRAYSEAPSAHSVKKNYATPSFKSKDDNSGNKFD